MRAHEFMELKTIGSIVDTLNEIETIDELVQPSEEHKKVIASVSDTKVDGFTDIYYGLHNNSQLAVSAKKDDIILGYTIAVLVKNPNSNKFPVYLCPKNLYSWVKDGGITALNLIKAVISLAGNIPVMSDIQLSPSAKKFLKKNVESGSLTGKVFNLSNGNVTPYDPDIWESDDNYRILFLEHYSAGYPSGLIIESTWNWNSILKSRNKYIYEST